MSKRRLYVVLLSSVLVGSLFAASAGVVVAATPTYVDDSGDDANPGTASGLPKHTINAVIAAVDVGGTVIVGPGTYPEFVLINKSVTLLGANSGVSCNGPRGAESIIIGDAGGTVAVRILADNVTFNGFQVTVPSNALGSGIHADSSNSGYTVINNLITGHQIGMYADSDGASWIRCNWFFANNQPGPRAARPSIRTSAMG